MSESDERKLKVELERLKRKLERKNRRSELLANPSPTEAMEMSHKITRYFRGIFWGTSSGDKPIIAQLERLEYLVRLQAGHTEVAQDHLKEASAELVWYHTLLEAIGEHIGMDLPDLKDEESLHEFLRELFRSAEQSSWKSKLLESLEKRDSFYLETQSHIERLQAEIKEKEGIIQALKLRE